MSYRPENNWQHSSGAMMHVFELTFDDGSIGQANAKNESPWYQIGSDVVVQNNGVHDGVMKISVRKPEFENAGPKSGMAPNTNFMTKTNDRDSSMIASWAIDHAMMWPQPNKDIASIRDTAKQLMDLQHELKVHHKSKFP